MHNLNASINTAPNIHSPTQFHAQLLDNSMKNKIKSGIFAKSNVNLVREEALPHLRVLKTYAKRTTFDQLDFENFVAGKSRIILLTTDADQVNGRLRVLCMVAHWMCRCRGWSTIRCLYEAILDSIELGGGETCQADFSHYETMVPIHHNFNYKLKSRENSR